ncbi:phosphoribosylformylglycinamidine cyclo-ligase [Candidatus Peregrinibacteria bacterium CG10_big_fil_rev_8_21_14_0_10_36_19]|nr:MAG: phosphoribosylformylglycinamidine cyclo-ligase [Candidatus Peregrinibacteria bacterium CG10_big_fil_rev_8_21_14_0_10_36_19]
MATYEESGVNIELGDKCSQIAYTAAKNTFIGRRGMIGEPVLDEGGFAGALDMGDFFLIQNDDGVGTKIKVAEKIGKLNTLGYDLVAMVADDAACLGAETISVSNTLDVNKVDAEKVTQLMAGLEAAALEHKIVVPGGEIAELSDMTNGYLWNATAMSIVKKNKIINGQNIKEGDKIIGLRSAGIRSNGFTLVRYILKEAYGEDWEFEKYDHEMTWGEVVLTPSKIYTSLIMDLHGRFEESPKVDLKGIVHVTGGGIPGNLPRLLKKHGFGANLDNLFEPHEVMKKLIELGNVSKEEAYRTWNMGVGMIIVSNDVDQIIATAKAHNIEAQVIGEVTQSGIINIA